MATNLSVEYPKLQNENIKLRQLNKELLEALKGLYNLYQDGKLAELINDESEVFSVVKIQMRIADLAIKNAEQ